MENFNKLQATIANANEEAEKFFVKGNKSAGTRLRALMQEVKGLATEIRKEVTAIKNAQ